MKLFNMEKVKEMEAKLISDTRELINNTMIRKEDIINYIKSDMYNTNEKPKLSEIISRIVIMIEVLELNISMEKTKISTFFKNYNYMNNLLDIISNGDVEKSAMRILSILGVSSKDTEFTELENINNDIITNEMRMMKLTFNDCIKLSKDIIYNKVFDDGHIQSNFNMLIRKVSFIINKEKNTEDYKEYKKVKEILDRYIVDIKNRQRNNIIDLISKI